MVKSEMTGIVDSSSGHEEHIKVVVLSSLYPNPAQPVFGNFVRERIRRLASVVSIVTIAPVRYRLGAGGAIPRVETRDGIRIFHPRFFVVPGVAKWSDGFMFALSIWRSFRRLIREFRPDLIDAHWGYPDGFAAYLLARVFRLPVVITVRGSDVNVFLRERLRGALMRYCLLRADRVIAVSAALKASLVEQGIPAEKVVVVRNGVDSNQNYPQDREAARLSLGLPVAAKIIMCVGNIVPIKGQDVLLEAFAQLRDEGALLVFVGDGNMRSALMRRALEFPGGLGTRVQFAGTQPHDKIASWFAAADVVCLPSRNEGLPNVVLEALACGRPIVATRVGGVEEVMTSPTVGLIVRSEDPTSLCQALRTALGREWDLGAIRQEAMKHSWDNTVRQCTQVWRDALNKHDQHGG